MVCVHTYDWHWVYVSTQKVQVSKLTRFSC